MFNKIKAASFVYLPLFYISCYLFGSIASFVLFSKTPVKTSVIGQHVFEMSDNKRKMNKVLKKMLFLIYYSL